MNFAYFVWFYLACFTGLLMGGFLADLLAKKPFEFLNNILIALAIAPIWVWILL